MIVNHVSRVMGAKRLTIREVAERAGVAYATVQGIRNDSSKRVDWKTLDALCRALEVGSLAELIEYVPDEVRSGDDPVHGANCPIAQTSDPMSCTCDDEPVPFRGQIGTGF